MADVDRCLIAERRIDHGVNDVQDQIFDGTDLRDHIGGLVRPDADDDLD